MDNAVYKTRTKAETEEGINRMTDSATRYDKPERMYFPDERLPNFRYVPNNKPADAANTPAPTPANVQSINSNRAAAKQIGIVARQSATNVFVNNFEANRSCGVASPLRGIVRVSAFM
jgi:hypothetical protein